MNTALAIRMRENVESIKTDYSYVEVFPRGILNAGMDILRNEDMRAMAGRAIFQVGLSKGRADFVLSDLYRELMMLDLRYEVDSGNMSEILGHLTEDETHEVRNFLNDLSENEDMIEIRGVDEIYMQHVLHILDKAAKRRDQSLHPYSMRAICRLALEQGYRIIIEGQDLTSFGAGIFKDLFEPNTPEEEKTEAIHRSGLSFVVILNDTQYNLPLSEPITNRIKQLFPEADSALFRVRKRVYQYE